MRVAERQRIGERLGFVQIPIDDQELLLLYGHVVSWIMLHILLLIGNILLLLYEMSKTHHKPIITTVCLLFVDHLSEPMFRKSSKRWM